MEALKQPGPLLEVAIGLAMLVGVILLHGFSIRMINRRFSRGWARVTVHTPHWRVNLLLGVAVGSLAALHMLETLVIAAPLAAAGIMPNLRDSYYLVLECYTTLGQGNLRLPEPWRLLGPIIAMSGLFTFGWTGSVLVSIMTEFGRFDSAQADEGAARTRPRRRAPESAQRQSRPRLELAAHGPITTFCAASSARATVLPARARSTSTRPSSDPARPGGGGHNVAHVHEAVGLLGHVRGVVGHLPEPDVVPDRAVAPQPRLEQRAGDQALVGQRAQPVARRAVVHRARHPHGQQVDAISRPMKRAKVIDR